MHLKPVNSLNYLFHSEIFLNKSETDQSFYKIGIFYKFSLKSKDPQCNKTGFTPVPAPENTVFSIHFLMSFLYFCCSSFCCSHRCPPPPKKLQTSVLTEVETGSAFWSPLSRCSCHSHLPTACT